METIKNIYKTFHFKGVFYLIVLFGNFRVAYGYTNIYIKHKLWKLEK